MLTEELATRFVAIALGHVTKEYPHKLDHVLDGDADLRPPRMLHPIFFGSFDWHSCVHAYWLLARIVRRFPDGARAGEIRALFDRMLLPEKAAVELDYLARSSSGAFERPYGWAWLLALHRELPMPWKEALAPLADAFAQRMHAYLPRLTYAIRTGTHFNTAFALLLARGWAGERDPALVSLIDDRALHWFGQDRACPGWEPSGDDFLSSALIEAVAMQQCLPAPAFSRWFGDFLPDLAQRRPATLFTPAIVSDRSDGKIAHLDGVNLSRAWCWRRLAKALGGDARRHAEAAAEDHLAAALPFIDVDYAGTHWLATYAALALDDL